MMRLLKIVALSVLAVPLMTGLPAGAQEAGQRAPYEPPTVQFDEGISLIDAVRLALENNPDIKLSQADADLQAGAAQEQRGAFDATLFSELSYEYRQQELRDSTKEFERDKRQSLRENIQDADEVEDQIIQEQQSLQNVLDEGIGGVGDFECPGCDPFLVSQIRIIDQLIIQAREDGNQALFDELVALRNDVITERLAQLNEVLVQLLDGKAAAEQRLVELGPTPDDEVIQNGRFQVGMSRLLRNGIQLSPFFEGNWDRNVYKGKPTSARFGGKGIEDLFTFRAGVSFTFPLLRGRGRDAVAAGERAAEIDYEARLSLSQHQAALSVLQSVLAYWDLVAAQQSVDVAERSLELQNRLFEVTDTLIQSGEMPGAERARSRASRARAEARLEDARRDRVRAQVALADVLGIEVDETEASLPVAGDAFPDVEEVDSLDDATVSALAREAMENRRDLMAVRSLTESGRVLLRAAEINMRPLLDLSVTSWFTALAESNVDEALERWVGPSANAELTFQKPLGNNALKGRHAQRRADLARRSIDARDLQRVVQLAVVRETQTLADVVGSVLRAQEAVGYYQQTIDAEIEKLRLGSSTLIDSIITEEQQTSALLSLVFAESEYAKTLARLRFESGTLVTHGPDASEVTPEILTTLPVQR